MSELTSNAPAGAPATALPAFERVALHLRDEIIGGRLRAGQALIEAELTAHFGASRNTIRESLRQLRCEGLVDYQRNRGVFVRELGLADVRDIYQIRRTLQIPALTRLSYFKRADAQRMAEALDAAEQARERDDWTAVGTYSLRFHQAIVALLGSPRFDDFFASIVAQLRLLFVGGQDERTFQRPWVERDRDIYRLLAGHEFARAGAALGAYLDDSEAALRDFLKRGYPINSFNS